MSEKKFTIVGQGLAGSMLAFFLLKKGQKIQVYDAGHEGSASSVAAGLINPITGRRIVKSNNIEVLLPFAEKTYLEIEAFLGIKIWHPRTILWTLSSIKEENDWAIRSAMPDVQHFIEQQPDVSDYLPFFKKNIDFGEVKKAAQVDLQLFIATFRNFLKEKNCLIEKKYDSQISDNEIVIYCEGEKARHNPLWSWLPFNVAKGEALWVDLKGISFEKIIKNNVSIIPIHDEKGKKLYWVGANNEWLPTDSSPTEAVKDTFIAELDNLLNVDYEALTHKAAIRPCTKDRQLFLGFHPEQANIAIFNGLGTKGTSLAPFWASHFVSVLLENEVLSNEVTIEKWLSN
jgi:glycine oxidase